MTKPLVSILIPAYNAEHWIAHSLQSAVSQTWQRKEIIVVDDGSTDRTVEVARRFASKGVKVVSTENRGLSAAVNHAYQLSQGDYIQELDADDLLAVDKIERQLAALQESQNRRILLSSSWAHFLYRPSRARFIPNSLWQSLSPVEWLLRKMGENHHMQNATWLVSRELAEAAGPWDATLQYDQDGEYFCRVLLASEGTCFVPDAKIYYRVTGSQSISFIGSSSAKRDSLLRSIKVHIKSLCSLENSERVRKACLTFLQTKCIDVYPDRMDLFAELQRMAGELQGHVEIPSLRWKYAWMRPIFGYKRASLAQAFLPQIRTRMARRWDEAMFQLGNR